MLPKGESPSAPPTQLHAPLKPTTGMHDVYFVFKNDTTPGMIMIALTATFVNGTSSAAAGAGAAPGR